MPGSAKDDIIDLTDIVEEGHPDRPNLKPARYSSGAAEEMPEDLDLEKEIDQIFADLAPPPAGDKGGAEPESAESDVLGLDELFMDQEDPRTSNQAGAPADRLGHAPEDAANQDVAVVSEMEDDFEKLFAQAEERQETDTEMMTGAQVGPDAQGQSSSEGTDWPMGIENGPEDDSAWGDAVQHPGEQALETVTVSDQFTGETFEEAAEPDAPVAAQAAEGQPPQDQATREQPGLGGLPEREFSPDFPASEGDATAGFGAAWDAGEASPFGDEMRSELEPPSASGPERIDPADLPGALQERLQAMEARLAALEQRDDFQPDMDSLPALVDERIKTRIREALPGHLDHEKLDDAAISNIDAQIQQALEGLSGQIKIMVAKAVEDKYTAFAEAVTDEVERRFEQFLEARLDQHMDRLFERHKAGILEEVRQNEFPEASVLNLAGEPQEDEHPDPARIAELAAGLEDLRDEVRAEARDREQQTTSLLRDQEGRITETFRQEMQALRKEWDEGMDTLATHLQRSATDLAEQQAKLESLAGAWQAWESAQDQELAEDGPMEQDASLDPLRDERLAEFLTSRLDAMRAEVLDEMRRAVPLAAAQIIREEIQALVQEED